MASSYTYRFRREGEWNLLVLSNGWSQALWVETLHYLMRDPTPSNHPSTRRFDCLLSDVTKEFYLKIYPCPSGFEAFKDLLRDSRAFRALKQADALSRERFHVPQVILAGEQRKYGFLKKAFLLTEGVAGLSLPAYLQRAYLPPLDSSVLRKKRQSLRQLALEVRRLHQTGFVHGDLIPSNILVRDEPEKTTCFYLDHDRTRRYPTWFPHGLWKRNLIQLNRIVLPRISLQDRVRFFRSYLGEGQGRKKEARLSRWLEVKTRRRRKECDGIESPESFRELMRWNDPFNSDLP